MELFDIETNESSFCQPNLETMYANQLQDLRIYLSADLISEDDEALLQKRYKQIFGRELKQWLKDLVYIYMHRLTVSDASVRVLRHAGITILEAASTFLFMRWHETYYCHDTVTRRGLRIS